MVCHFMFVETSALLHAMQFQIEEFFKGLFSYELWQIFMPFIIFCSNIPHAMP